jgi:hypothetical protein
MGKTGCSLIILSKNFSDRDCIENLAIVDQDDISSLVVIFPFIVVLEERSLLVAFVAVAVYGHSFMTLVLLGTNFFVSLDGTSLEQVERRPAASLLSTKTLQQTRSIC